MKFILLLAFSVSAHGISAQIGLKDLKNVTKDRAQKLVSSKALSADEVSRGLKEALIVGVSNSVITASEKGGFNKNFLIKIPFPPQAEKMKKTLSKLGKESEIKNFEYAINEAAEHASKSAKVIFLNAIKDMTINDAIDLLNGSNHAATDYLKNQTSKPLYLNFKPIVKESIKKVRLAVYWRTLTSTYNSIPLTKDINPDIEGYVTNKTIDGLFVLIAQEEEKIRNNPQARVSEILQKVFR